MIIDDKELPDYLIKFAERKEYLDDIINGKIYMKESGYFRKLEDNFRGDELDGLYPIDAIKSKVSFVDVEIPPPSSMNVGFVGDDKIPMFCATFYCHDILDKMDDDSYRMKIDVADELKKFGKYALIIHFGEFIYRIKEYAKNHDLYYRYGMINYSDKKFLMESIMHKTFDEQLDAFFKKDISYKNQNEWRLILLKSDGSSLISEKSDSITIEIDKLEGATGSMSILWTII